MLSIISTHADFVVKVEKRFSLLKPKLNTYTFAKLDRVSVAYCIEVLNRKIVQQTYIDLRVFGFHYSFFSARLALAYYIIRLKRGKPSA